MKFDIPFLIFEATQLCNLNCRYCYNPWKRPGGKPANRVSYGQARKTLGRLVRSANIDQIAFTGGEPLLLDGIEELVLFCRLKGLAAIIITNGNVNKPGQYSTLVKLGVSLFELPVHSNSPVHHDFMTRCEGSWHRAVRSIERILALGGEVAVSIVLCKPNIDEIPKTLSFLNELGVRNIMLNRFNIGGEGIAEEQNLLVTADQLQKAFHEANEIAGSLDMDISSNVCTPFCIINPSEFVFVDCASCVAGMPDGPLTIDAFGSVRLCNHSPYVLGNIHEEKLPNMTSSQYAKDWKSAIPDDCSICRYAGQCKGGCRAASEQCGQTVRIPDPILKIRGSEEVVPETFKGDNAIS